MNEFEKVKTKIALYTDTYLTVSMTFIYRQLKGLRKFEPIVLTEHIENRNVFPFREIYSINRDKTLLYRLCSKFWRTIKRTFVYTSKKEMNYYIELIRKNKIALVHSHFGPCGIKMLPARQKCNVLLVTTFHGYDASMALHNGAYLKDLETLFKYGDFFIAVSNHMKKKLVTLGCPETKIMTIYYGVPLRQFEYKTRKAKDKNEKLTFLQVSNFVEKKGHEFTVRAFYEVKKSYPNVELLFVGDGPLRAEIENLVNNLGLNHNITFLGKKYRNEIPSFMYNSDIFIHPSITGRDGDQEGIPNVIMEAMATGMPVISTYHSGIPELAINNETGFLTREKDIATLSVKMIELCKNEQLRWQFGIEGRKQIEKKFDIDIQNKKLEQIYTSLLKNHPKK